MKKKTIALLVAIPTVAIVSVIGWETALRQPAVELFEHEPVMYRSTSSTEALPEAEAMIQMYMESPSGQEVLRVWAERKYIEKQEADIERRKEELREQELSLGSLQ